MELKNSVFNTLYHKTKKDKWGNKKEKICYNYLLYFCDDGSGIIRKINLDNREILSEIKHSLFSELEKLYAIMIRELCISNDVADFCLMVGGQIDVMNRGWEDIEIVEL